MYRYRREKGFTIVELLIVIVVIAILAAISIVSYTMITRQANNAAAESSAIQSGKKLALYAVEEGSYPSDLASLGFTNSASTTYEYSYDNQTDPKTFCVTVTVSGSSYYISSSSQKPIEGICDGHLGNNASPASPRHSVYGATSLGAMTVEAEGAPVTVAASFYRRTAVTDGWRVVGGRLYVPEAALSSLPTTVTMFWFYDSYSAPSNLASRVPVESKTITLHAGWNEVYWDAPYSIAVGSSQRAWVGYTFGTTMYLKATSAPLVIEALDGSPIKFADKEEWRSDWLVGSQTGESDNTYGIDIIFDEGP